MFHLICFAHRVFRVELETGVTHVYQELDNTWLPVKEAQAQSYEALHSRGGLEGAVSLRKMAPTHGMDRRSIG